MSETQGCESPELEEEGMDPVHQQLALAGAVVDRKLACTPTGPSEDQESPGRGFS